LVQAPSEKHQQVGFDVPALPLDFLIFSDYITFPSKTWMTLLRELPHTEGYRLIKTCCAIDCLPAIIVIDWRLLELSVCLMGGTIAAFTNRTDVPWQ